MYGDFRIVRNDISRMSIETMASENRTQSFFEDLNRASEKVLQALQGLATRIDSTFDVNRFSMELEKGNDVSTNDPVALAQGITSPLSRALDRIIPLTLVDGDTEYCHGAVALQKVSSRSIEDIAIGGKPRMQYTYVCKFCFLQISSYGRSARHWGPYEWETLAKSHVVACTTWLDSRALFKCIDCDKLGTENVTIDAADFIMHTQDHLQNATTGKVPRDSAYFRETFHSGAIPRTRSHRETMADMEREITAYEKVVEMELAGDPVVQNAKIAAVPLVEEDEDGTDIDELYQRMPNTDFKKESPQTPNVTAKPRPSSNSTVKSLKPDREMGTAPLGPGTSNALPSPPPYEPNQQSPSTEAARQHSLGGKLPLTPVPTHPPEPSKDTRPIEASVQGREATEHLQKLSKNLQATDKAGNMQDATLLSPVRHRQADVKAPVLPTPVIINEPNDGLSNCPCCQRRMKAEAVFEHLDTCPSNIRSPDDPTQKYAYARAQGSKREAAKPSPSVSLQNMNEAEIARMKQPGATTGPVYGDNNPYQPGNRISSTGLNQGQPSVPTRLPPAPPEQQAARPKVIRQITPAEADENYRAQGYSGHTAQGPQTPSRRRNSRDLHVRQSSTAATLAEITPQPPGAFSDWQNYPTFEEWQSRQ
jgi:hypothetical protein